MARWSAAEDRAEDAGLLNPDDRLTCHVHGRWIHQCVSSPVHVNPVTRHRWCRDCAAELTVAVDELAGTVTMRCPQCGQGGSAATARLLAACCASLSRAGGNTRPRLVAMTWSRRGAGSAPAHGGSTLSHRPTSSAPACADLSTRRLGHFPAGAPASFSP
ncbi:hypothetical protein GCM10009609_17220 [Pseudonocardia aurantiaca]